MNINVTPQFILAGNAVFTVSNQTGQHYTYRIYSSEPSAQFPERAWFIQVLVWPDDYRYVGKLEIPNLDYRLPGDPIVKMTGKSKYPPTLSVKVVQWAVRAIWQTHRDGYKLPPGYSIKHEGKCGRCGRPLTNPASLDTGLGPECASQVGVEWAERSDRQPLLPVAEIRVCEKCGKRPANPNIEACDECAKLDPEYATGQGLQLGERTEDLMSDTSHPGHPSNYGDR